MEQPCSRSTVTTPNSSSNTAEWSSLPRDILQHLLNYMDLTLDLPRIRGVCSTWRTSLPLDEIPKPPAHFRVPDIIIDNKKTNLSDVLLLQSRFYLISPLGDTSPSPWLARIAQTGLNKWHLLNPFNLDDYFYSDPPITTRINLLDSHLLELAKPWSLQHVSGKKTLSKKVVGGWNLKSSYIFAVLAQLKTPGSSGGQGGLVFKRLHDRDWVPIKGTFPDGREYKVLDIAYHNGLFYAFDVANWKVGVMDPSKPEISFKFIDAPDNCLRKRIDNMYSVSIDGGTYILYGVSLVPCNAHLYFVISLCEVGSEKKTLALFVLRQGEKIEEHKWERVTSLGDQILFIWYDVAFGVSSTILPNWKPGSICLFIRPIPLIYDACQSTSQELPEGAECLKAIRFPEYWRYLRMYDMEEEEKGMVEFQELPMEEYSQYTGLIFPPPAWVKCRCPSLDNVEVMLHNVKFIGTKKRG